MSTDTAIIVHALSVRSERRLRITVEGTSVNVTGDDKQPTNLVEMSENGCGKYLTDGKTFEAIVAYDVKYDLKRIVVYRLMTK